VSPEFGIRVERLIRGPWRIEGQVRRAGVRTSRAAAVGVTLAVVVSTAAGCGGSDGPKDNGEKSKPATQVAADSAAALERAGAVHLLFKQNADSGDMRTQAPDELTGTFTIEGGNAQLRSVGGQLFFQGDAAFYKAQGGSPSAAGAWVKLPGQLADDEEFKSFGFSGVLDELRKPEDDTYNPTVEPVDLEGRPALKLTTSGKTQIWVSSVGEPYPLRVVTDDEGGPSTIDFTEVGQRATVEAPKSYVDGSKSG
jgi:hypothetical protein